MAVDSLKVLIARSIAREIRRITPLEPLWTSFTSVDDIKNSLKYTNTITRDFVESLASLEPHLALLIHKELTHVGDEWGIVLSLLLRSLDIFKVDLSDIITLECSFDTTACTELAATLAPPNLTSFEVHDSYGSYVKGINYVSILSKSECASTLRSLRVVGSEFEKEHVESFSKFVSLTHLNLTKASIPFATVVDCVLRLPQLVELSSTVYSSASDADKWVEFLQPLLGDSKETFNAPNIAALRTRIDLTKQQMQRLVDYMKDHKLAGEIRQVPLCSIDSTEPETLTLMEEALRLMPLEKISRVIPWESVKHLLPIARSLKELTLDTAIREGIDLEDHSPAELCLRFNQQTADYLAEHTPVLEKLVLWCSIEGKVDLSSLSLLKNIDFEHSSIPIEARTPQLDVVLPTSIEQFSISFDDRSDLSKLGPALKPLHALKSITLSVPCFLPSQLQEFVNNLPESIIRFEASEVLCKPTKGEKSEKTIVSLRLPQVRELLLTDSRFRHRQVYFEFATAPRLVGLSMIATAPQLLHTVRSLLQFPHSVELLRAVDLIHEGQHDEDENYLDQFELSSELAKYTQIRSLSVARSISPGLLCIDVIPRLRTLSFVDIRNATVSDSEAATICIWWLRHKRLERFDLSTRRTALSEDEVAEANAHILIDSERLPNATDISVSFHQVEGAKSFSFYVEGLKRLQRLDVSPARSFEVENNPKLTFLSIGFEAGACSCRLSNLPELDDLSLNLNKNTGSLTPKIEGTLPKLADATLVFDYDGASATPLTLDILNHSPKLKRVTIYGEQSTLDVDALWAAGPKLKRVDHNNDEFHRP